MTSVHAVGQTKISDIFQAVFDFCSRRGADGLILPSWDAYRSEMPPERNMFLSSLTGFGGSYGVALFVRETLYLLTDGRYLLQARDECCVGPTEVLNVAEHSPAGTLGRLCSAEAPLSLLYDDMCWSYDEIRRIQQYAPYLTLIPCSVDEWEAELWAERPAYHAPSVFRQPPSYAGEEVQSKLSRIRTQMKGDYYLEPLPEHVAWALNIRAWDMPHTPAPFGRLLLHKEKEALWFCYASARVPSTLKEELQRLGVTLLDEECLEQELQRLPQTVKIEAAPTSLPFGLYNMLGLERFVPIPSSLCALPQAIKNSAEIAGARTAHILDGAAVTRALFSLERMVERGDFPTETRIQALFQEERRKSTEYIRDSFTAIVGAEANGAIIHYRPREESAARVTPNAMILIDSGGQYQQGTTDVTRTLCLFKPDEERRALYTSVLKGHIALARARFPAGTKGSSLDALARQFLRAQGKDYAHGTGHGVGSFLGVHEGPQRISMRAGDIALAPGMILSNEPGYYREGGFGIRIENLMYVISAGSGEDGREWLAFETLTLIPYDARLVAFEMLDTEEKAWLTSYHERAAKEISPLLTGDDLSRLYDVARRFGANV